MSKFTNFIKKIFNKEMAIGGAVVAGAILSLQPDNMAVEKDATNDLSVKVATLNSDKWTYEQSEQFIKKYADLNRMVYSEAKRQMLYNQDFLNKADPRFIETAIRVERKKAENRGETFEYCLEEVKKPIIIENGSKTEKDNCITVKPRR